MFLTQIIQKSLFVGGAVVLVLEFEEVSGKVVPQSRQLPIALALKKTRKLVLRI
jgi:hypothetical protein